MFTHAITKASLRRYGHIGISLLDIKQAFFGFFIQYIRIPILSIRIILYYKDQVAMHNQITFTYEIEEGMFVLKVI